MKKLNLTFILFLLIVGSCYSQQQTNERAKWFTDARFGMFIHWGLYSGAEGYWKGEKIRNDNDYAEWIYYRNRIERDEYVTLLDRFDWNKIDPEKWVILAKESGMKYITFTAKHHDGFALWNSKVSDYDLGNYTNPPRDIVKELAEACRKHGIKIGLYYSHWVDWEHRFGWDHTREIYGITPEQYDVYWQEKVIPQMRELLSNYGPIDIMWFDMWIHHSKTIVSKKQLLQLKALIRELQPNCLVNSRLGLSIEEDPDIDFKTLGDNQIGSKKEEFPWQSPATVAHSWGFHSSDFQFKSTTTLLKSLINNVSLNGNFMLNIGPRANGDVPFEISQRMREMGKWLQRNGEAIYGAGAFDLPPHAHDWGKITAKETTDEYHLFLHVFNWPLNKKLPLTGITDTPDRVRIIGERNRELNFTHHGAFTEINLENVNPDPYISVIELIYNQKPKISDNLVAKTTDGGYSMNSTNLFFSDHDLIRIPKGKKGTIPSHVELDKPTILKWKIYIDRPGDKRFDISYFSESNTGNIRLKAAGKELSKMVRSTGKTVGEPNQNWVIDNFSSSKLGIINFKSEGEYSIELQVIPENKVFKFQWLWMK